MTLALNDTTLALNCLILGDNPDDGMFTVKISDRENIYALKDSIRMQMAPRLNYIPATELDLWQVQVSLEDDEAKFVPYGRKLTPHRKLNEFFKDQRDDHMHVIVKPRRMSY